MVELDSARGRLIRRRSIESRLVGQIAYYLSDRNWPRDLHMQQRAEAHGGFFPLCELIVRAPHPRFLSTLNSEYWGV